MKKVLLSAVALMAFGIAAQAQDIKFGVKAGVNIADLSDNSAGSRVGFHVGGLAEFGITEQFSIQPELLYSGQGAKVNEGFGDVDLKLDYISLPVLAKYRIVKGFSVEAGPQVGFLISAKAEDEDVKDAYKSVDFGVTGGAEYELPMGVFFQARYYVGLSSVTEDIEVFGTSYSADTNNIMISLSAGYRF